MTNRERVLATLQHRQPDRIPCSIGFTKDAHARMAAFYGDPKFQEKIPNCFSDLHLDTGAIWREVRPNIWADEFGVEWNRTVDHDIGVVCNTVITEDNIETAPLPPAAPDPALIERIRRLCDNKLAEDRFVGSGFGFSLFERAWTLAGMETILMWMAAEPEKLHRLLDRILELNLARIDAVCALDIDSVYFGDDWGQQNGLIMGPHAWREFFKPRLREMYGLVKRRGKFLKIHSCGCVQEIFPDLIEMGLDVFNPFQPEVMDPFEMKRKFGDRLCFHGGISTQRLLPYGTPDQVRTEVRRLLDEVGRNGGYFAAPAHAIPGDAKPENIHAMLEVLKNQ